MHSRISEHEMSQLQQLRVRDMRRAMARTRRILELTQLCLNMRLSGAFGLGDTSIFSSAIGKSLSLSEDLPPSLKVLKAANLNGVHKWINRAALPHSNHFRPLALQGPSVEEIDRIGLEYEL